MISSTTRFLPFGEYWVEPDHGLTDKGFTGHAHNDYIGLVFMRARFYVPAVGRFAQADTIVPDSMNPQSYNRYSYVLNRPVLLVDPTGHYYIEDPGEIFMPSPWELTDSLLDLDGNGEVTVKEAVRAHQRLLSRADDLLLQALVMPAGSDFRPFGSQRTVGCDGPGQPPCNATRHPAVDSLSNAADRGDPVYAIAYGTVVRTGWAGDGFGNYVIIEHNVYGARFYSVYAHNDNVTAAEGMVVQGGGRIAEMGSTVNTSVHLHFEIRRATNVDLDADHPFIAKVYWPGSVRELNANFVNLSSVFGLHPSYDGWADVHP